MNIHDDLYQKITPATPFLYEIWEPTETIAVIGNSQNSKNELFLQRCLSDHVPVLKRRGGGGTVILTPGVLCLTMSFFSTASDSPYYFFKLINYFLIEILETCFGIMNLEFKGISDIAISNKKILGCSIFKSRNLYHYQGSLLVNPDLLKITRYLRYPSKEPDYRKGRTHLDFLTSIAQENYPYSVEEIKKALNNYLSKEFYSRVT